MTCSGLSLSWNDSISVSTAGPGVTLKINGNAKLSNAKINQSGSASRLSIQISGSLSTGSDFRANANFTVEKAVDLGYANVIVGNLSADTIETGSNSTFSGNMNATAINTASDNQMSGNLTANIIQLGSSNTLEGGLYGGSIYTGSANSITGPIQGSDITIGSSSSRIEGNVSATNHLEIGSGTTVIGDLNAYSIDTISAVYLTGDVNATTSFILASGSSLTGEVNAPVVEIEPSNASVYGDIFASTSLTIGSDGSVYGNIQTGQAILKSSNALVDGNILADSLTVVDWGGRVTGDVTASHITNNGTIEGGTYCDTSDGYTPTSCSASAAQVHHFLLSHSGLIASCESQYPVNVVACADATCSTQTDITGTVEITERNGRLGAVNADFNSSSQTNVMLTVSQQALYPATFELSTGAISGITPSNPFTCQKGLSGLACQFTVKDSVLRFVRKGSNDTGLNHQVAGVEFELELQAITTDAETGLCNAALTNNQTVAIDLNCQDPGLCSNGNWLTVNNVALGDAPGNIQADFGSDGQAVLGVRYDDAGKISLDAATSSNNSSKILIGSSSAFTVKPAAVAIDVVNASGDSSAFSGAYHDGSVFAKAGEAFSVKLRALNALGGTTNNFGNESVPRKLVIVGHQLLAPLPGQAGHLANQAIFSKHASVAGLFENHNVSFSEVGVVRFSADVDQDYLGAGKVTPLSESNPVGRFIPAHFALTDDSVEAVCNGFSYMGQPFGVKAQILAQNTNNQTTANYQGLFAKSANLTLAAYQDEDLSGRLSPVSHNLVWGAGVANLDTDITFVRPVIPPSVDGPFDNLQLGLQVNDSDSVPMQTVHADFLAAQAFAAGSPTKVRYGRAVLANAYGPETEPLPLPLQIEYYQQGTTQWQPNLLDNCTAFSAAELMLVAEDPLGLVSSKTGAGTVIAGKPVLPSAGFVLSSAGQRGDVTIQWQLPSDWLKYDWQGSNVQEGPKAKATFGQFRGNDRLIFQREVFH
ncbi:hypothetical protein GCM10010982_26790 [Bowmanella pacifica]|uniref:DUF6701 domain-containing protein n=1 Tax=Bowmanella pacifica TaxID=502051 RepID=A0A917Z0C8_9ALTE|nr:hypothetical protein GCM10010982_26790 [Bowmanella pacifica]